MSEAVWYWREGPMQHGPITWEKLRSLAECGKISPSDWVMREGWPDWKLACEAADSGIDPAIGPPPEPPPLLPPLPPPNHPVSSSPPAAPVVFVPAMGAPPPGMHGGGQPPFHAQAPMNLMPMSAMGSAALPMPPMPMQAAQPFVHVGPGGPADAVSEGDVHQLRRVLSEGPEREQQPTSEWNLTATLALGASITGLLFLALEMGLLGLGLGGWCLYTGATSGTSNGKSLAFTAIAIGGFNVVFRILCATVDMGLTM
jgi:hypothetical protein